MTRPTLNKFLDLAVLTLIMLTLPTIFQPQISGAMFEY